MFLFNSNKDIKLLKKIYIEKKIIEMIIINILMKKKLYIK
jgi:hypothetical protein